jgi:hypothetical protein
MDATIIGEAEKPEPIMIRKLDKIETTKKARPPG